MLEALALRGALDPNIDKAKRASSIAKVAEWLGRGDLEAVWSGEVAAEGGYLLKRLWRGVTDAFIIEPTFLASAEARKLHALAAEQVETYASPLVLRTLKKSAQAEPVGRRGSRRSRRPRARRFPSPARPSCSTQCSQPAAAASRSSATKAWAK